jgi:hypothetical protein
MDGFVHSVHDYAHAVAAFACGRLRDVPRIPPELSADQAGLIQRATLLGKWDGDRQRLRGSAAPQLNRNSLRELKELAGDHWLAELLINCYSIGYRTAYSSSPPPSLLPSLFLWCLRLLRR